jgi:hypothetical protein
MKHTAPLLSAFLGSILLFTSCATTKPIPLSGSDRAAMRGKTVTPTRRAMPDFAVMTPGVAVSAGLGGAIGGAIAGGVASARGKENVAANHLDIPDETISRQVMKSLVAKTGARPVPAPSKIVTSEKPEELSAQYAPADYILDVRTTGWMSSYYPMTLSKYFVVYGAQMRLIDAKTKKVIAQGFQSYRGEDKEHAPDYDGIYSNNAAFLRTETKKGTDAAAGTFSGLF